MIAGTAKQRELSLWIIYIPLSSQFLSHDINCAILILLLFFFIIKNDFKFIWNLPGKNMYFYFLVTGVFIGLVNLNVTNHSVYSFMKHISYVILPFIYWSIGYFVVWERNASRECIFLSLTLVSVVYSAYDVIHAIYVVFSTGFSSLYNFRTLIGNGSFLPVIGVYLLVFYKQEIKYTKNKIIMLTVICTASSLIHFSRALLIELFVLLLFSGLRTNFREVWKCVVFVMVALITVAMIFPDLLLEFLGKIETSIVEISYANSTWTHLEIVNKWRGYEMYCETENFNSSGIIEKIFGGGFGTTLDAFGMEYLVTSENTLIFLHNGYFTQLMLWGLVGVAIFIIWVLSLYKFGGTLSYRQDRYLVKGMSVILLTITYFVRGPLFGASIAIFLFYFALLSKRRY